MADTEMDETAEVEQDELDSNGEEESLQDAPETSGAGGFFQYFFCNLY